MGLETGVDGQQPQQGQDWGGDERSPGCQMKEAFTVRVTVAQAFFFGRATQLVGSHFPDQGSHLGPQQ